MDGTEDGGCLASRQETVQWVILSFYIDETIQTGNPTSSSISCVYCVSQWIDAEENVVVDVQA